MPGGLVLLILCVGCNTRWQVPLAGGAGPLRPIASADWSTVAGQVPDEVRDKQALPLERLLWRAGVGTVESLQIGERRYEPAALDADLWLLKNGCLQASRETICRASVWITAPVQATAAAASITDPAPTIADALQVPAPSSATGRVLGSYRAGHAAFIVLDGLGYDRAQASIARGDAPFLQSLGEPRLALSVYPSVTRSAIAALLTGTTPERNGVVSRNQRNTEVETLFDGLAQAGKRTVAVEGSSLAFNLRNAELVLSGDRDGNGSTDDNVLANALRAIGEGMPDLLWVHFHGIDDLGHTYGPGSAEQLGKIAEVDSHLRRLVQALPPSTLVLVVADHGMHAVQEGDRLGNHGSLRAEDMLVPLWVTQR